MEFGRSPAGLPYWHPATVISTWWWSGLMPFAPGTWGALFTLPAAWLIASNWGSEALFIAAAMAFVAGLWSSRIYLRHSTSKDPGSIVIDETAGQFLTLALVPAELEWYVAGFFLFRIADIFKPWPASWADRSLTGPLGVMTDDIFAALYALAVLSLGQFLIVG